MAEEDKLSEMQQKFVDEIFNPDNGGNLRKAADRAGYSKNTSPNTILKGISGKGEILRQAEEHMALYVGEAMNAYIEALRDPTIPGTKIRLDAADRITDKAGLVKKDKAVVEHKITNALLILPAKEHDIESLKIVNDTSDPLLGNSLAGYSQEDVIRLTED